MPLKKLVMRPGVNRENTSYVNEGGWYDCDKARWRKGTPEAIGGWQRVSVNFFLGVCRSLWSWATLGGLGLTSVGTNLKFYIESGGVYNDITPLRATVNLTDPFATVAGSSIVTVTDAAEGFRNGDFVTFSGASVVGGLTIGGEYQLTLISADTYTVDVGTNASSTVAAGGGSVSAAYQLNVGPATAVPTIGWGAGGWGAGPWGVGTAGLEAIRFWSQGNFGEDLVFGPVGGGIYYWDATNGLSTRGVALSALPGASETPLRQNHILISDINRFVFCFGTNDVFSTDFDPMLVRWSDQENAAEWSPSALNQAGSLRLSRGSQIVTALQSRQEILVWTDSALYSLQYVGAPIVWSAQLVGENISIASRQAAAYSNGVAYWMARDKFYIYDGRSQTLPCDVREYIFGNLCYQNYSQVFSGTNERYHEIWWFYCERGVTDVEKYVVFNYLEKVWYYGNLSRSAWLDSGLQNYPIAATYDNNVVYHEFGVDDNTTGTPVPIHSFVESSQFDLDDGDRFMFVRRLLPDMKFDGSASDNPTATITIKPMKDSGSGYNNPMSEGGESSAEVVRSATAPIDQYTRQVNIRVRGRQAVLRVECNELGTTWKLGAPRLDMQSDGGRG